MGASKNKDILKKVLDFAMSVSYIFVYSIVKNVVELFLMFIIFVGRSSFARYSFCNNFCWCI